ncbi:MAG: outer membrane protein assembly factor BamD [Bacteroidetes bacterium]|nr:outer membrane protein assembly factor BamD [Bacteroidota bacterium]
MKKCHQFYLLVLLVFIITSCQFSHLLKSDDAEKKYAKAIEYYTKKDYSHALQLFDQLMTVMKATDKAQRIYYFYSYCYYGQKDFTMASYYFKRYVSNFPNTKEAEECSFMSAYCNYMNSPDYSLDQTNSYDAIKDLQLFVNTYPTSSKVPQCNDLIDKLREKLEYKDYHIARLYYKMEDFAAAIRSFNNILKDYPDSPHKEEIMFYIVKSYSQYAKESIEEKKKDRYLKVISSYNDFVQQYPASHLLADAKSLKEKTDKELNILKNIESLNKPIINKKK